MLGTSTRKHGRDTSICEAVKDLRAVAVGVQDEEVSTSTVCLLGLDCWQTPFP